MPIARSALTEEERVFCRFYLLLEDPDPAVAYRRAYPKECEGKKLGKEIRPKAEKMLERIEIQSYIAWLKTPSKEQAADILKEQVSFGSDKEAKDAASVILKQDAEKQFESAVHRWASIMDEIGAEIVVPLGPGQEAVIPFSQAFKR